MYLSKVKQAKGFTLVELLIVVIILAILAAIIVPQFSASTNDAKAAALQSNLANLRSSIEFYYQEHGEYPGANIATGATCGSGAAVGTGAANSQEALIAQLSRYTNDDGLACTGKDATFKYGPYLKGAIPDNPEGSSNTIVVVSAGVLGLASAAAGGWRYDTVTGEFIADN
ncbi:MAG: prepilin-type N-terminal cleavage/methylation domain-containing protein [Gammaproteobacteria bacterium]|nr:MAG: prepilin-type N-terminal cleavage/methylation domain-containing protein [Gammaproteobacteria bacterium]